ncbi:hypothetical protein BCR33DRAFT_714757 [Rhizoclosmatium globosum]|uniref:Uncharacterized protein n=1 Tax=Rhizoclosmatium globosum TaxID=329046 RepID=A0A1Y2CKW4_9FUNG|nr:hypothetical protein BCR33DRAFT_714757 [Rhizoclosmatium globosum]|eukprot:ORY47658.1 hypothetical protein BCR33DRAFT_714757 [Rhizoclosmatium globosum]
MDSLNSRKEPTYSEGVQLENLEVDPAAPVKKIRKKRKIIQELRAKAKGKGKGDVADGPMQPKLIGTVTPNLKDSRNEKSGVPSAEVSVKPTAPTTSAAPIPPTSPSVKTKKKKRGKRKTERKSDEMDIDTSTASHVEPVPTALPPQQPQPPIQQPESTVDEPKTKKKKKPFNRVRKPRVEAISVAITATISENIEATNIVNNIPPLVSAPAHTVPAAIISEPPDVIQQLPLQQPAPMPETTPPAPLISLQPTRKRKLISLETSDDDDEKSEIEIPQNPSTKQQPPTLNPSEPPSKSKKWRSKQRTRTPAKSQLLTTLHNYSVETLETLLWSLRTQLVKMQALEYIPTWRHGQYCLDWWQHRGRVFASGCKFIRGLETVYRVNTQENREVEEGEVEESVVSKSILSLANEVLMDVKPHVRLFRNIRERVVGMDGPTLVTGLILREIETLQETFVEDTRRQVLQKTKVIRSEISRLWREIGLWNDECTSVKELSWKQEVFAVTEMLMKDTGEDSDLQDIKEDFESSIKEEQIRENARVKLVGLLWLYRLWMSSIF